MILAAAPNLLTSGQIFTNVLFQLLRAMNVSAWARYQDWCLCGRSCIVIAWPSPLNKTVQCAVLFKWTSIPPAGFSKIWQSGEGSRRPPYKYVKRTWIIEEWRCSASLSEVCRMHNKLLMLLGWLIGLSATLKCRKFPIPPNVRMKQKAFSPCDKGAVYIQYEHGNLPCYIRFMVWQE